MDPMANKRGSGIVPNRPGGAVMSLPPGRILSSQLRALDAITDEQLARAMTIGVLILRTEAGKTEIVDPWDFYADPAREP
jgi:hypothetical protein